MSFIGLALTPAYGLTLNQPVLSVMIVPRLSNGYLPVAVSSLNSSISSGSLFPIPNFIDLPGNLNSVPANLDAYIRTFTPNGNLPQTLDRTNLFVIEGVYTSDQPTLGGLDEKFTDYIKGFKGSNMVASGQRTDGQCVSCVFSVNYKIDTSSGTIPVYSFVSDFYINGVFYLVASESSSNSISLVDFSKEVLAQKNYAVNSGLPKVSVTVQSSVATSKAVEISVLIALIALVMGYFWYRAASKRSAVVSRQMAYRFQSDKN